MNEIFDAWWREWSERNERLVAGVAVSQVFERRRREIAGVERWARAHIEFWFGDTGSAGDATANAESEKE